MTFTNLVVSCQIEILALLQGVLFWTNEPTYSVTSNCLSLKNQRFTPSGYKGIGNKSLTRFLFWKSTITNKKSAKCFTVVFKKRYVKKTFIATKSGAKRHGVKTL